jgi:transcriptional antiterminator RfaH
MTAQPQTDRQDKPLATAWFCLRSQPKHEHIAAAHLRKSGVEVFLPRLRFKRTTRTTTTWVIEALFPNYLFARFDWTNALRLVCHSPGVSGVVHFGDQWPVVPDQAIDDLRACLGNDIHTISPDVAPGDAVRILGGCLHGLEAIVTQVMPGKQRVAVLLDFLGRQTSVKLDASMVVRDADERELVLNPKR